MILEQGCFLVDFRIAKRVEIINDVVSVEV